ncbi:MAG: glycoside hydrolase family 3 C-terminal domain-containing protein [Clostridia bacterium]|nr:glycoside hydrolase family 3 C-terminal domain-containing protein [Clostridia bacterium]
MKTKTLFCFLFIALLCGVLPLSGGAYAAADGADKSQAAAAESFVLLKNEKNALPLTSTDKIAIFGAGQVYTDGKTGGFFLMGRGSGYFVPSETPQSPCDVLASYADAGKLGGVYAALTGAYKAAAVIGEDFTYSPTDAEYTAAAGYADKAIYIINRTSAEGSDLAKERFELTDAEKTELTKVCAAFGAKPVIVILNTGNVINTGFANGRVSGVRADALLTANYPGIRGIDALCKTLIGEIDPSGKTADTFAKDLSDYPSYNGFYESRNYTTYYEDIYMGYRYFETFDIDVDYPFGYGLSYTTFSISNVTFAEMGGEITVTARVTNTGSMAGKEVVQVYFGAPQKGTNGAKLSKAAKELCGFQKTSLLAPGASETVTVSFAIDDMASYDDLGATGHKSAYVLEAGDYTVYVGNSVRNTVIAGRHTESALRLVEQLSQLCEPTVAFDRKTFDGTERVGTSSTFCSDLLHTPTAAAQTVRDTVIPFSATLTSEATVDEFLAQMTNEELGYMALMTKASPTNTGAWGGDPATVEKYGMPLAYTCDGPAGIRHTTKGTGLPSASALACTWNPDLVEALGDVIGRECVATDIDVWLAPGVNLHRFPLCGRNFEYYSEDPYLAGVLASSLITGVQTHGVPCAIKHFVANEKETNRFKSDSRMSERALRELYLVPFQMGVESGVDVVMTSYNLLNGTETAESAELLRGILRGEWGFDGLVTTDWSNDSKLSKEVIAGNNVHSSTHWGADGSSAEYHMDLQYDNLMDAVRRGTVSRSLLIENAKFMVKLLSGTYSVDHILTTHTVAASGASTIEAEDFTYKYGGIRPEKSGSITVMAYMSNSIAYALDVQRAGTYILDLSYAKNSTVCTADSLRVFVDGKEQLANFNAVSTGGWYKLSDKELGAVYLPAGKCLLKLTCPVDRSPGNLNALTLTPIEEAYTAISSPAQLVMLMRDSTKWSGNYYLTADIDLSGVADQSPIGTTATNFTGKFDGMGHTVTGLALTTSSEIDLGLFGKVKGGVIRNLTVYGSVTSGTAGNAVVGGIVGTLDPDSFIVNCTNCADVSYHNTSKAAKGVGGVCGYVYAGSAVTGTVVKNCVNRGAVKSISGGKDAVAGGITGIVNDNGAGVAAVKTCQNFGSVYGEGAKVGGIVGYLSQAATGGGIAVAYCENRGAVTFTAGTQSRTGGIAGFVNSQSTTAEKIPHISFCANYGDITTDVGYEAAGILGFNAGADLDNCVNFGALTAGDGGTAGGVLGKTYTSLSGTVYTVSNCYTTVGDVLPNDTHETPEQFLLTDCALVSKSDLTSWETTLTYGAGGYTVREGELLLSAFAPLGKTGDIDGDGNLTVADIIVALRYIVDNNISAGRHLLDINGDGRVTLLDILRIMKLVAAA